MSTDDPFFAAGDDRTVLKPSPGGRRPSATPASPTVAAPGAAMPPRAGLNRLVAAANPLFGTVVQLRHTYSYADPAGLRENLVQEVKAFEAHARQQGASPEQVATARYALCTLVDETVLGTPWGSGSAWNRQSLLVTFHKEVSGGEKFYQLLQRMLPDPSTHRELLEFWYVCLALGLEGRYRVTEGGRDQLEELRERLFRTLQNLRGDHERELSPHWQGVTDKRNPIIRMVPLWVTSAVAAALLLGLYWWFSLRLNDGSDRVYAAMHGLRWEAPLPERVPPPRSLPPVRLSEFLAPEIRERLVTVEELPARTTVRILGDGLFASGSAAINASYTKVLGRIADGLNTVSGQVLVTGHTDDRPIHSLRFPSNWHLSTERAKAVVEVLAVRVLVPQRLTADGRADTEPLAPNDSPAHRARNRRVEIRVLNRGGGT